jgi:hypothetical protein
MKKMENSSKTGNQQLKLKTVAKLENSNKAVEQQ